MGGLSLSSKEICPHPFSYCSLLCNFAGGIAIACEQLALPFVLYLESLWITL